MTEAQPVELPDEDDYTPIQVHAGEGFVIYENLPTRMRAESWWTTRIDLGASTAVVVEAFRWFDGLDVEVSDSDCDGEHLFVDLEPRPDVAR